MALRSFRASDADWVFALNKAHEVALSALSKAEIQALVAPSPLATPRRAVVGWDSNRLAMVLAVLEARCRARFSDKEV